MATVIFRRNHERIESKELALYCLVAMLYGTSNVRTKPLGSDVVIVIFSRNYELIRNKRNLKTLRLYILRK